MSPGPGPFSPKDFRRLADLSRMQALMARLSTSARSYTPKEVESALSESIYQEELAMRCDAYGALPDGTRIVLLTTDLANHLNRVQRLVDSVHTQVQQIHAAHSAIEEAWLYLRLEFMRAIDDSGVAIRDDHPLRVAVDAMAQAVGALK